MDITISVYDSCFGNNLVCVVHIFSAILHIFVLVQTILGAEGVSI